jgi:Ca-activated chloride channel family protein
MTFLAPEFLLLLLLLPVAAAIMVARGRARAAAVQRVGESELMRYLSSQVSPARRLWKAGLWLAALGSLVIALARPVWGADVEVIETQGVAVMVVLDVSSSMDARDVAPSRLERAKLDLRTLFEGLAGNQIGLILFAGTAYVQLPLTSDVFSAEVFLNAASSGAITQQGTAIDSALRLALDSLKDYDPAQSVIVLASDGESQQGDPLLGAQLAADRGIKIYTVGYGTAEGSTIPVLDSTGKQIPKVNRANGQPVITQLSEQTLRTIAQQTGGSYARGGDGGVIPMLINQVNALPGGKLGQQTAARQVERFEIFVLIAVLALTMEILLPETRGRAVG